MPRKLFKRWIPDPSEIRKKPALKFLGVLLHDPNLFHLNRHSVSVAFFVGLFLAFLPLPGQIPLAALGALLLRCNLPIAITLVWITNPLTFPFIYFGAYMLGARILQTPIRDIHFDWTWSWFETQFPLIWQPLLLGCLIASVFFGALGYVTIQWTWRWHVIQRWKKRQNPDDTEKQ